MTYKKIETDYNKSAILKSEEPQQSLSKETKDELMHYGVMGMRWGIRRYQDYGEGGYNPKKKGVFRPKKDTSPREKVKHMSDDELNRAINRMRKEDEYIRLSEKNKKDGMRHIKNYNDTVSTLLKTTSVTTGLILAGKKVIDKLGPALIESGLFDDIVLN